MKAYFPITEFDNEMSVGELVDEVNRLRQLLQIGNIMVRFAIHDGDYGMLEGWLKSLRNCPMQTWEMDGPQGAVA